MRLDLTDAGFLADPYPAFAAARAAAPMHWDVGLGMWLAVSHPAANAVLRDRRLGRIWRDREPLAAFGAFNLIHRNALLEMEPPDHARLRRLVAAAFARGHVERLRDWVGAVAAGLADEVADAGSDGGVVDLISTYAEPLPVAVIAELLGVPESDRPLLRPWSNAIVRMYEYERTSELEAVAEHAAGEFVGYLRAAAAERRRRPADDLISHLVGVRGEDGSRLTEDELVTTCILLLNAGHEASVNVTANGTSALLAHPEQLARLRADPSLVPTAVEELIRYDGPLQLFERTAVEPVEVAGTRVEAGQRVAALLGAANRDPDVFADPDRLDVGRADNPHIGFGAGVHFCLGAPLARVELQASLGTLVARFPAMAAAGPPTRRPEFVIRGLSHLPVTLQGP